MSKSSWTSRAVVIMMRVKHKQVIPLAWILTSLAIFLLCFDSCLINENNCFRAGDYMLGCMILITFPCGLLYPLVLSMFFNSISVYDPFAYFLLWLGAFAVGYLQWFVLLPRLFSRNEITTLGIAQSAPLSKKRKKGRKAHKPGRNRIHPVQSESHLAAQWDEGGRTPLERVINDSPHGS